MDRREFLSLGAATVAVGALAKPSLAQTSPTTVWKNHLDAYSRTLHWLRTPGEVAKACHAIGHTTIDLTVRPQLIFLTATRVVGVAPQDGTLLWSYPWKTTFDLNIATPVYADGQVFVSSNYGKGGASKPPPSKSATKARLSSTASIPACSACHRAAT